MTGKRPTRFAGVETPELEVLLREATAREAAAQRKAAGAGRLAARIKGELQRRAAKERPSA